MSVRLLAALLEVAAGAALVVEAALLALAVVAAALATLAELEVSAALLVAALLEATLLVAALAVVAELAVVAADVTGAAEPALVVAAELVDPVTAAEPPQAASRLTIATPPAPTVPRKKTRRATARFKPALESSIVIGNANPFYDDRHGSHNSSSMACKCKRCRNLSPTGRTASSALIPARRSPHRSC